jgi:hypothetical protein
MTKNLSECANINVWHKNANYTLEIWAAEDTSVITALWYLLGRSDCTNIYSETLQDFNYGAVLPMTL